MFLLGLDLCYASQDPNTNITFFWVSVNDSR